MKSELYQESTLRNLLYTAWKMIVGLSLLIPVLSCGNITSVTEETGGDYLRLPFVRVLLDDANSSVKIDADKAFSIECLKDGELKVYHYVNPVIVEIKNSKVFIVDTKGTPIEGDLDEANFFPRARGNFLMVGSQRYRGLIKILPSEKNEQVINVLYMEDYLRGVVPPEIGERTLQEIEAVKAQAVASRTYALAHLGQYEDQQYDIKSSIIDQLYNGYEIEQRP